MNNKLLNNSFIEFEIIHNTEKYITKKIFITDENIAFISELCTNPVQFNSINLTLMDESHLLLTKNIIIHCVFKYIFFDKKGKIIKLP